MSEFTAAFLGLILGPFGVFFDLGVRWPLPLGVFFCFGVRKVDPLPIAVRTTSGQEAAKALVVRTTSGQEVVEAFDEVGVGQAFRRDYGMRI